MIKNKIVLPILKILLTTPLFVISIIRVYYSPGGSNLSQYPVYEFNPKQPSSTCPSWNDAHLKPSTICNNSQYYGSIVKIIKLYNEVCLNIFIYFLFGLKTRPDLDFVSSVPCSSPGTAKEFCSGRLCAPLTAVVHQNEIRERKKKNEIIVS